MPLELPPFNVFKPKQLKRLEKRIASSDLNVDISFDDGRIEKALDKLKDGLSLTRKDYKILCFHIEKVRTAEVLDVFLPQLREFFNKFNHYPGHLKGLLVSYYDLFKDKEVYDVLQYAVIKAPNIKYSMQLASNMVKKSADTQAFVVNMYEEFDKTVSITELSELSELYLLGKNKNLYISILQLIIAGKVKKVDSSELAEYIVDLMDEISDVSILKPCFETFLLSFKDVQFFDNQKEYIDRIFEYIGDRMGDPYRRGRAKWMGMNQDAIDIYTLWKTQKNIKYFFGDIAGDYERLQFWKRYSHYFLRVEYMPRLSGAILMESKEHMFVEFAEIGAMYMFRREIQNIDQVENYSRRYNSANCVQKLKDRYKCTERMIHTRHQWQINFRNTLANHGYKARG